MYYSGQEGGFLLLLIISNWPSMSFVYASIRSLFFFFFLTLFVTGFSRYSLLLLDLKEEEEEEEEEDCRFVSLV